MTKKSPSSSAGVSTSLSAESADCALNDFDSVKFQVKRRDLGYLFLATKQICFAGFRLLLFVINSLNALEGVFKLSIKS